MATAQEMQDRLRGSYGNKVDLVSSSHWTGGPIEALYSPTGNFENAKTYTIPESEFGSWTPPDEKPTLKDVEPLGSPPIEPPGAPPAEPPPIEPPPEPPPYEPPDPYIPSPDATVEDRVRGLLDSDSPYIRAARQRGIETAHSRGLLNSSIAAGSAERSAIEAALPIALQDAAQSFQSEMAGYQGEIEAALAKALQGQELQKLGEQARLSSLLEAQAARYDAIAAYWRQQYDLEYLNDEARHAAEAAAIEAERLRDMLLVEHQQALELEQRRQDAARELERIRQDGANYRLDAENSFREAMSRLELTAQEQQHVSGLLANLGDSFMRQLAQIQVDPNLDADAKKTIIEQLRVEYRQNVQSISDIHGVEIDWGDTGGGIGEEFDGGSNRNGVPQDILDYMDSFPEGAAWKEYQRMKEQNPGWTVEEWARQNRANE